MGREDSLGEATRIPKLSTERRMRVFNSRRSQSSVSSTAEVPNSEATSERRGDLLVSGMKLRSEKNLDCDEGRSAVVGRQT